MDNTHLTCPILASEVASVGTLSIRVFNPAPSGGFSAMLTLTVNAPQNPTPTLASITPTNATAGASQLTLTANGQNFTNGAVVRWNGSDLATAFVNAQQLTATIPANLLSSAGNANVTVFNPSPGGGVSNAVTFTIDAGLSPPAPTISSLSPAVVTPGAPSFTLAVLGANFTNASQIQVGGVARSTTFVSANRLEATIAAGEVASAGTLSISVTTAGVGTSASVPLPVQSITVNLPKLTPAFVAGKATLRIEQGKTFQTPIKVEIGDSIADLTGVTAVLQMRRHVADEELGVRLYSN